ncbi:MAG TPA: aquaporin, partial [Solirubrobacterales bacterium]
MATELLGHMDLKPQASGGEGRLVASYGVQRFTADWDNPSHRAKRLLAEFLGVAGLMVILSGVAAILARFAGAEVPPYQLVAIAAITSGTYLVAAIYFLGDISAHFDPVVTLAFGIRRDMAWGMVVLYWIAQFAGAACGSLLIRSLVGSGNKLAMTLPPSHMHLQATIFE